MIYSVEDARTAASVTPALPPAVSHYRRPGLFYLLALGIPWLTWGVAGYFSRRPDQTTTTQVATAALGLLGLVAPIGVAASLIGRDRVLRADVRRRLVGLRGIRPGLAALAVVLLPASLLVATGLSVLAGYPAGQFGLRGGASFTAGLLPAWLLLVGAAIVEELAWHSYGTDALASRWTVWRTTCVFAVFWFLWHVPLSFIKGYYQAEVVEIGPLASVNFVVSVLPFMILMNWLYYRCGRSILVAIVFHVSANVGNELFLTHPDTKVIQTGLLLIVNAVVLWRERRLFFTRPLRQDR